MLQLRAMLLTPPAYKPSPAVFVGNRLVFWWIWQQYACFWTVYGKFDAVCKALVLVRAPHTVCVCVQPAFGAQASPAPAFGAQSTPMFGAQSSSAFGSTTFGGGNAFGGGGTVAFGAKPAFGSQPFGAASSPAFGAAAATPAFGQSPGFGAPTAQAFGQTGKLLFKRTSLYPSSCCCDT